MLRYWACFLYFHLYNMIADGQNVPTRHQRVILFLVILCLFCCCYFIVRRTVREFCGGSVCVYTCYSSVDLTLRGTDLLLMCPSILPVLFTFNIIGSHGIHSPRSLCHSWVFISLLIIVLIVLTPT